ncbi:MAG: cardiolipin synthase [Phycisphaeraceae bacterium]|nr:cardiolipin synthase [Phycisphaeraceae bacterium]
MFEALIKHWPIVMAFTERAVAVLGCAHVVLHKRDPRAAGCWVGLIVLAPFLGTLWYVMFGINRLRRHGGELQQQLDAALRRVNRRVARALPDHSDDTDDPQLHRPQLVQLIGKLTERPLLPGNSVSPLLGGDAAYDAMIEAINGAQKSVGLCSYIFDADRAGNRIIDALDAAQKRGVAVRVLIDDMGSRFLFRSAVRRMKRLGITCARFLPAFARRTVHLGNLRNHRKILLIDGLVAFTGGMNIHESCLSDCDPRHLVRDVHFSVRGPVVTHIAETFAADWLFATGQLLLGDDWFAAPEAAGTTWARGITDGPDEDYQKMLMAILGAIEAADRRIDIVTPYFLPDDSTLHSLHLATLRGVKVRLILPRVSNHRLVQWAGQSYYRATLEKGCAIYLSPPPFDHSKLMLVDDDWSLIGSTNWDPRSLQLNFEFNIECYDRKLNRTLSRHIGQLVAAAEPVTQQQVEARRLPVRLRDDAARLLTPYL